MINYKNANEYIRKRIKDNTYPEGHPFNDAKLYQNDFIVFILSMLKAIMRETEMIDDYIDNKLKASDNGKFNKEKFFQSINEIAFFYYLLSGIINANMMHLLIEIRYENFSITNPKKKLEFTFLFGTGVAVCTEIKTITCDPYFKEKNLEVAEGKYIKKYFHNCELNEIPNLCDYHILHNSTHDRQLRKNIKKIVEKFDGKNNTPLRTINLGVLFIQFATSIEEFYAYLLNKDNGILLNQDLGNIDCLVFFSLTQRPQFDMQDVYELEHTFSILLNNENYVSEYLKILRLDNFIAKKNGSDLLVREDIEEFTKEEYGIFRQIVRDGMVFFVPIEKNEDEIQEYLKYLKGEDGKILP